MGPGVVKRSRSYRVGSDSMILMSWYLNEGVLWSSRDSRVDQRVGRFLCGLDLVKTRVCISVISWEESVGCKLRIKPSIDRGRSSLGGRESQPHMFYPHVTTTGIAA